MTTKQTSQPDPDEPAAKPPPMPPVEEVPLSEIHPDPRNARRGNVAEIASSLREFGQHRAVVVQRSTGKIIAGNHVYHAARSMGWETIGVVFVDDDDEKALRRGIADNATGDLATWDTDILRELMEEVGTDIPGITDDRLEELAAIAADAPSAGAMGLDEEQPMFPVVARVGEQYAYVVVVAENEVDVAWLKTRFGVREERSFKGPQVAESWVVTVKRMREVLG